MVREQETVGLISVTHAEPGPFASVHAELLKTFADQAVIAIENVRLFNETKEALEQQTATGEILSVISRSPTDVQPVFDAVAESAARLCDSFDSIIWRPSTDRLVDVAHHGPIAVEPGGLPLTRESVPGRALLDAATLHLPDLQAEAEEFPVGSQLARRHGFRTVLNVPLMRDGAAIGVITLRRTEIRPFSERQVALLKTFADQAVIAIENVRLFNELEARNLDLTEALDQQTATAEILRVISQSPTDVQPVFDAIASSAVRLCESTYGVVHRFDGTNIELPIAMCNVTDEQMALYRWIFPLAASMDTSLGEAALTRRTVQVEDTQAEHRYTPDTEAVRVAREVFGYRTVLMVPMVHRDHALGIIAIWRREQRPYSPKQITLVETFADQAVIAIENVRLFKELQTSNRELTTALDTQTATSDILRVISRSQTDVQPVFEAILSSAVRLLGAYAGALTRVVDNQIELAAFTRTDDAGAAALRRAFPQSLQSELPHAQAIRDRAPLNIADAQTDPRLPEAEHVRARVRGFRSWVLVPLLRHDEAIGAISVARREPGGFNADEISLLQTFADQVVIAIENVRLFGELKSSNRELRIALEQQTATSELLKVIGRSTFDLQPVFETLAENAVRLCQAELAFIYRFDGQRMRAVATYNVSDELRAFVEQNPIAPGRDTATARAAFERRTIHIHDVRADSEYTYGAKNIESIRTVLVVPMLRASELLGAIQVYRHEVRPFTEGHIVLMETFADQAAIAIDNARLLGELQARTTALARSVDELTALAEVSRALSSTLDLETVLETIVTRAVQLSAADAGTIFEYDALAEVFHPRVSTEDGEVVTALHAAGLRKGEGAVGRMAVTNEPTQISDIGIEGAYESRVRDALLRSGRRAVLALPLLREEHIIGGLVITRNRTGEFSGEVIELLKTFATQSTLAIQNARLFRELAEKSRELEIASQHKSEFLANMSHELRTPLNAIIGFSEVLSDRMFGELNEKQEEYLKDIYASGTHLLSLINDILDLSKIEAGRMELELTDFHLPTALNNALTLVRERAGRRSIALLTNIDDRLGQIQADERKVRQVILNLLSNAIKFTPDGGRIEVAAVPKDGLVEVSVSDTGIGIAPEDQEKVFEEFRQVGTAAKKVEGTGLGLTLCRKFIELHGGRIWVKSQVGAGSTFTFTIPVRVAKI
jgi:GAF domain-containing protein